MGLPSLTAGRVRKIIIVRQYRTKVDTRETMPPRRISRTITFSLPPDMFEEVQRVKDEEGRDMSELVREALRLYMEDRELRREQRLERLRSRQAGRDKNQRGEIDE